MTKDMSNDATKPTKNLYGLGFNDLGSTGDLQPYYTRWLSMLTRCYSDKTHKRYPSYKKCEVSKSWLIFSNFKSWMEKQDWEGMCLDKDILVKGNKVYSAETCIFIPHYINVLFNDHLNHRGEFPTGVHFNKRDKSYSSMIRINGKRKWIGCFKTPQAAHASYIEEKIKYILKIADCYPCKNVSKALKMRANDLRNGDTL